MLHPIVKQEALRRTKKILERMAEQCEFGNAKQILIQQVKKVHHEYVNGLQRVLEDD